MPKLDGVRSRRGGCRSRRRAPIEQGRNLRRRPTSAVHCRDSACREGPRNRPITDGGVGRFSCEDFTVDLADDRQDGRGVAVAEDVALGFRRRRLSNRDLFVLTLSALPVEHSPWVGRAGRERRAPVSRFCQVGRGIGVRASYAPRRRSAARTWSRNGGGAASGAAGFGFAMTAAFFATLAAICASRLAAKSLAFASTGSASAPSRAMR